MPHGTVSIKVFSSVATQFYFRSKPELSRVFLSLETSLRPGDEPREYHGSMEAQVLRP